MINTEIQDSNFCSLSLLKLNEALGFELRDPYYDVGMADPGKEQDQESVGQFGEHEEGWREKEQNTVNNLPLSMT